MMRNDGTKLDEFEFMGEEWRYFARKNCKIKRNSRYFGDVHNRKIKENGGVSTINGHDKVKENESC